MKKIASSLLLVVLLSCGTSQPNVHNRISIQFRDSAIGDFFLLSVRDHSVVVAPYASEYISVGSLIITAKNVPFEKIEKIYYKGDRMPGSIVLPALGGAAIGGCATCHYQCNITGDGGGMSADEIHRQERIQLFGLGGGFLAGALLGYFFNYQDQEYSLTSTHDIQHLRNFYALFPNKEPSDLEQIK
ncbi:MAG: hypothetical protein Q8916_05320 [Bacteroidota bacterium]|nr:hypothetical protein [Bacteroidota bacterium]MDP4236930.1 hypothetical protein [Bacteroidota bacterium]